MAKKTTFNYNEMRMALVKAHNAGNDRAIDKQRVTDCGISMEAFSVWKTRCDELHNTVFEYFVTKNAVAHGDATEDDLKKLRNNVFTQWKKLLEAGEASKTEKTLHVTEGDIEDLYGFAWKFMGTRKGTVRTQETSLMFRKKVESLIGCRIAGDVILNAADRDILDASSKAEKKILQLDEKIADGLAKIKSLKLLISDASSKDFKDYINHQIGVVNAEVEEAKGARADAVAADKAWRTKAKPIEDRIALAKVSKIAELELE